MWRLGGNTWFKLLILGKPNYLFGLEPGDKLQFVSVGFRAFMKNNGGISGDVLMMMLKESYAERHFQIQSQSDPVRQR